MEFLNTTNWREALHQTEELFEEIKKLILLEKNKKFELIDTIIYI